MLWHIRMGVHPPRGQVTRAERVATEGARTRAGSWVPPRHLVGQYGNLSALVVGHHGEPPRLFSARSAGVTDRVAP